ncbi:MAG: ABC transporter substrate-binding protein [bacterium]
MRIKIGSNKGEKSMFSCKERMRLFLHVLIVVCMVSSFISFLGCNEQTSQTSEQSNETLYQKVLKAGAIRCSYVAYPPYCIKDPNTGNMTGIFVEVMEEVGRKLELKIEWVEEVGWGTIFEGFESGRYDVHGSGLWQNSSRGKTGYFSVPLFYNAIRVWVRSDDKRFKTLSDLNSPEVRIAVQDGAMEDIIAKTDFPKAQRISVPQLNPWSDNLLNMITKKADVTFAELSVITPFLEKNPGTLKELELDQPIRVFANSYPFKMGEDEFKAMIDAAITELISEGIVENILKRYETVPGEYLRVALPYRLR